MSRIFYILIKFNVDTSEVILLRYIYLILLCQYFFKFSKWFLEKPLVFPAIVFNISLSTNVSFFDGSLGLAAGKGKREKVICDIRWLSQDFDAVSVKTLRKGHGVVQALIF